MKIMNCTGCGSKELEEREGLMVCLFCQTKYVPDASTSTVSATVIGLGSDIEQLLQKCRSDPANARRYAQLVLDIDPTNAEARAYLFPAKQKKKWF